MATTYTVVKNDNLTKIAKKYNTTVDELVRLNNIKNRDLIYIGQVLKIDGEPDEDKSNVTSKANITHFGIQANTDRTLFAVWTWDRKNTENYEVYWQYATGDGVWFVGNKSNTEDKQSLYTAPANATRVQFRVKPIAKKEKKDKKEVPYWTANWSTEKIYDFRGIPNTPPVPKVEIKDLQLTATIDNIDTKEVNAKSIEFQVVRDHDHVFKKGTAIIEYSHVSYSCKVMVGGEYKVRCRSLADVACSDWSDYSESVGTPPSPPMHITSCKAASETSVYLAWSIVTNADSYEIEYTTEKRYFDLSGETKTISGITKTAYEVTGLDSGEQYYFRVKATNEHGTSSGSEIKTTVIGEPPTAPTTYSSTTTAITGEEVTLYWVHNAEDGSSETFAELELNIGGEVETRTIKKSTDEDEKDKTSFYVVSTSGYTEGTKIQWRVRTAGITKEYGEWSIQRTVDIYAPPTLEMEVTDSDGNTLDSLTSFPFYVSALAGPNTQKPIGYHLSVISNEFYETVDDIGNLKVVNVDDEVYSRYFDISEELLVELSANSVDLENNVNYSVVCTVSMDSGLTAESTVNFKVAWADLEYEPNAEIGINTDNFTAFINPYCVDATDTLVPNVTLSVYRREYDGNFTEIASNLANSRSSFVTDPHPALDYARYRIVAKTTDTGSISYCDLPGYPVGGKAVIIQWDEEWSSFDATTEDELVERPWTGSVLILPYNIDVSDSFDPDVEHVEYIGREHPVSYHGTQIGEKSEWSVEIDKADKNTLYGVRRLAKWMGNVYVREPSGSGYWATVKVSFSQKHCDVKVPVSLSVTRVEGGV